MPKKMFLSLVCAFLLILPGCELWALLPAPATQAPMQTHAAKPTARSASPTRSPRKTKPALPSDAPSTNPSPYTTAPALSADPAAGTGGYRVLSEEFLTLRTAPSLLAQALARLDRGAHVQVTGFEGAFAAVTDAKKRSGYVLSGYLVPLKKDPWLAGLKVVKPVETYTYEQMMKDLKGLAAKYPGKLRLESAGKSAQGRDIPVAVLGDLDASHQVLLQGAVHAREYMTSLLMMAQLEYCLKDPSAPCGGSTVGQCLDRVCLRIIPMANPDGVTISQTQQMTDTLRAIYEQDKARQFTGLSPKDYLKVWKANALGVDINRNFPAGWESLDSPFSPSASRYRGEAPGDQPETQALMAYTQSRHFDATVSYHATGSALYWQYGSNETVNDRSHSLAQALRAFTKYTVTGEEGLDSGGYKDWAMDALGIPSVTVEIGSRDCPLPLDEFATIWARNLNVPAALAQWVKMN